MRAALSRSAAVAQTAQTNASIAFPAANGTFTLPAGKSITLTYQVTINSPAPAGSVSNQGSVVGSNFSTVLTDDPSTAAPNDATVTRIDQPSTTTLSSTPNPSLQGQSVHVAATVSGAAGTPSGSVQFKDNGANLGGSVTLVNGVASADVTTLSLGVHTITAVYSGDSVYDPSTGTLSPDQTVNGQAPTITTQPADQTVNAGDTATFSAAASGNPTPTVQWQVSTDNGANFTDIAGATSTTYSFTAQASQNGAKYRAVFTNASSSATSNAVTLTVQAAQTKPSIMTQPANQTVNAGGTASFSAAASGNPTPTVQWQVSTDNGANFTDIAGATSTTYSFTAQASQNGHQYRAVFTNAASTATSNAATLTVTSSGGGGGGGGTNTPELGSGELLATGLLPLGLALLYRRRRARRATRQ